MIIIREFGRAIFGTRANSVEGTREAISPLSRHVIRTIKDWVAIGSNVHVTCSFLLPSLYSVVRINFLRQYSLLKTVLVFGFYTFELK